MKYSEKMEEIISVAVDKALSAVSNDVLAKFSWFSTIEEKRAIEAKNKSNADID